MTLYEVSRFLPYVILRFSAFQPGTGSNRATHGHTFFNPVHHRHDQQSEDFMQYSLKEKISAAEAAEIRLKNVQKPTKLHVYYII